ncbi:MAG: phosphatidylserine decarboxylase proenzyme [Gammaproteobacteria bacterium]|nr:MAG: phosphatidylserine decarboxylase proenzyme [Gammaproteobacteria bacterium]
MRESLFMALQYVLPARLLAWLVYRATRSQRPWFKDLLIRGFVRLYAVDSSEADAPVPSGYASFNAFFTRELRPGARPLDADPQAVLSPADGTIQQIGILRGDEILQVKGQYYSSTELLGGDAGRAGRYHDGCFVTIYLAPWNYHRVHMPLGGRVERMSHVPGELWSVNATTAARVPRLFARNERLVCHCSAPWGPFAVVLVGALNVGSISTAWAGEVLPRPGSGSHWDYPPEVAATRLGRGATLGQFNMGSTVVLLLPPGVAQWRRGLAVGDCVRVGESLGRLLAPPAP